MDEVSLHCSNGHKESRIVGFRRRTEEEVIQKLWDDVNDPQNLEGTEALEGVNLHTLELEPTASALRNAPSKAGRWVEDNGADQGRKIRDLKEEFEKSLKPRRPADRRKTESSGDKIRPRCKRCNSPWFPDGITWATLQDALDHLGRPGASKIDIADLDAYIRNKR